MRLQRHVPFEPLVGTQVFLDLGSIPPRGESTAMTGLPMLPLPLRDVTPDCRGLASQLGRLAEAYSCEYSSINIRLCSINPELVSQCYYQEQRGCIFCFRPRNTAAEQNVSLVWL